MEVCVLTREDGRRKFRRLSADEIGSLLAG
jgi:hypothetical protein